MDSPSAHFAKESITLQHLQAFRKLFKEHAEQGVDERTFVTEFRRTAHAAGELGEAQLVELFLKIDANADGTLTWDEFTNFLFLDNHDTVDASSVGDEAQAMFVAAGIVDEPAHKLPTREAIVQTFLSGRPKEYLSVSRNGGFKLWRPAESRAPAQALPGGRKWVTACAHLPLSNKMVIGTVDSLLEVYDLSGDDIRLYCTLPPAELRHAAPICMAASAFVGRSTELLLVGDDVGTLTVYELRPDWGPAEEEVRPGRIQLLGARQVRIRQHQDHVTHVAYVPELSAIVSCSLDATVVVYDYARRCTKEVFTQHKKPVYYFAWCPTVKLIASCGLERNILLWSPYTHRAFFRLKGHSSPISRMFVTGDQLVSLGSNNVVKVWNLKSQKCVQTLEGNTLAPRGEGVSHILYDDKAKQLVVSSSAVRCFTHRAPLGRDTGSHSHNRAVLAVMFNTAFHQLVSVDAAEARVWNISTGQIMSRFETKQGPAEPDTAVACFDDGKRRLITADTRGRGLKLWNFSNGCLMKNMAVTCAPATARSSEQGEGGRAQLAGGAARPASPTCGEISSVLYVKQSTLDTPGQQRVNRYVLCAGTDRRVYRWRDVDGGAEAEQPAEMCFPADPAAGHRGDIQSMAYVPPATVLTGGADRQVILWNLHSGEAHCRLPLPAGVECMQYLRKQHLVVAGTLEGDLVVISPQDHTVYGTIAQAHGCVVGISTMLVDSQCEYLVTADAVGQVFVWSLDNAAAQPNFLRLHACWSAHDESVTTMDFVVSEHMVDAYMVTGCSSGDVRMWTLNGALVGTFGQRQAWDVLSRDTFRSATPDPLLTPLLSVADSGLQQGAAATIQPATGVSPEERAAAYAVALAKRDSSKGGVRHAVTPEVGDVWAQLDPGTGRYRRLITVTRVDDMMYTVVGWDGMRNQLEAAPTLHVSITELLKQRQQCPWVRLDDATKCVGRLIPAPDACAHDGASTQEPFKVMYVTLREGALHAVDTERRLHPMPNVRDMACWPRSMSAMRQTARVAMLVEQFTSKAMAKVKARRRMAGAAQAALPTVPAAEQLIAAGRGAAAARGAHELDTLPLPPARTVRTTSDKYSGKPADLAGSNPLSVAAGSDPAAEALCDDNDEEAGAAALIPSRPVSQGLGREPAGTAAGLGAFSARPPSGASRAAALRPDGAAAVSGRGGQMASGARRVVARADKVPKLDLSRARLDVWRQVDALLSQRFGQLPQRGKGRGVLPDIRTARTTARNVAPAVHLRTYPLEDVAQLRSALRSKHPLTAGLSTWDMQLFSELKRGVPVVPPPETAGVTFDDY